MEVPNLSECVYGLETKYLKKLFGVNSVNSLIDALKPTLMLLEQFGLTLRYFPSQDLWYLVAETNRPPSDLTKTTLQTLLEAYREIQAGREILPEVLADRRNLGLKTIQEHLTMLQQTGYINQGERNYSLTMKARLLIMPRKVEKNE